MKSITAGELKERLKKKDFILLDVRSKPEFDDFHIPGSILIPYDQLERRHKELDAKEDRRIICICRSGNRSRIACQILEELGYEDVTNVEDGLISW
jgi:rhodanese-related sulfurtransferase